jgi:hypothetical protein
MKKFYYDFGGNFQHTPDNAQVVSSKENERLSKYYRDLGLHFEMRFMTL